MMRDKKNILSAGAALLLSAFLLLGGTTKAAAATLQVGSGQAYATIQACANAAVAGDTCLVAAGGVYDERVTPANSGTSSNPITFLAAPGTRPKVRGFTLSSKSYITIDGFEVTHCPTTTSPCAGFSSDQTGAIRISGTNTGVKIVNNYIHHVNAIGIHFGSSSFLTIRGNDISYCGFDDTPMYASAMYSLYGAPSTDVLVENNRISYVADYFNPFGSRYVYRNNIIGPVDPSTGHHVDGWQNNALLEYMLDEGNRSVDNKSSDNHFFLTSGQANYVIARYNSTFKTKGGMDWGEAGMSNVGWSFYNNTFYDNQTCCSAGNAQVNNNATNPIARNNIWYRSTTLFSNPYAYGSPITDKDYDLCYSTGNCNEAHDITSDPNFVNGPAGDFNLQAGSPAIDGGGSLTTTANSGSNSTSLQVAAASLFQDGWAGVTPDRIAVGSTGNSALIASINYTTNVITLASPLSWSTGAPVYLHSKSDGQQVLYGSAPDIGAYEYGSTSSLPPAPSPSPAPSPTPAPLPLPPPTGGPTPTPPPSGSTPESIALEALQRSLAQNTPPAPASSPATPSNPPSATPPPNNGIAPELPKTAPSPPTRTTPPQSSPVPPPKLSFFASFIERLVAFFKLFGLGR